MQICFLSFTRQVFPQTLKRSDMSETFGVVYPTDKITVIGRSGSKLQIIYPLDSGGYKMGWINS